MEVGAPRATHDTSILLVLPVPFRRVGGELLFERQACNGVDRWADNFERVTVACPLIPEERSRHEPGFAWRPVSELSSFSRVTTVPLPYAYTLPAFLRTRGATARLLAEHIRRSRYLSFAVNGYIGDWAGVACREAQRQGRAYSVWVDSVEYEILRRDAQGGPLRRRLKAWLVAPLMKRAQHRVIGDATLGLFHGKDTFTHYAAHCRESHCVHDVHTKPADRIGDARLERKAAESLDASRPLLVCYAGRAISIKGPLDWVRAIHAAIDSGANIQATWLGDGPVLPEMKSLTQKLGIADRVSFPGFIGDREALLEVLRDSHAMAFCHKTPESPRCLIEALVSGCPIVGYGSSYSEDLTSEGGGDLVPMHDWKTLGAALAALARDRVRLAALIRAAGRAGVKFNDEAVFKERSDLIKRYLP
jgi:glycosyltransferase involved in cell wall biosynthesis